MTSNELENIILTIDSREESNRQDKTRTRLIESWATDNSAIVEHKALELCDYALIGEFRGHKINLGIEYKAYDNFLSDDISDMEDKLTRSFELYDHVAFFVDGYGSYSFVPDENDMHCVMNYSEATRKVFRTRGIENPPTKTLASMEGFFDTLSANGIHCRQLRSEAQFPYSVYNLLVYLTSSHRLKIKERSYADSLINHYSTIPFVGYVKAQKLINSYPSPAWLNSAGEESLITVLGKVTGKSIYAWLHNHELETDDWRCKYHADGTPRELEQQTEAHLCKTCTAKENKCLNRKNVKSNNILIKGHDVILCSSYINKYPSKSLTPDEKKHQAFKRQKASFKVSDNNNSQSCNGAPSDITPLSKNPITDNISSHAGSIILPADNLQSSHHNMPPTILSSVDEGVTSSSLTPNIKLKNHTNIDGYILEFCNLPNSMESIVSGIYPKYSKKYIFDSVCRMTNEGALRRFSDHGIMKWTAAVKADKELDIGV